MKRQWVSDIFLRDILSVVIRGQTKYNNWWLSTVQVYDSLQLKWQYCVPKRSFHRRYSLNEINRSHTQSRLHQQTISVPHIGQSRCYCGNVSTPKNNNRYYTYEFKHVVYTVVQWKINIEGNNARHLRCLPLLPSVSYLFVICLFFSWHYNCKQEPGGQFRWERYVKKLYELCPNDWVMCVHMLEICYTRVSLLGLHLCSGVSQQHLYVCGCVWIIFLWICVYWHKGVWREKERKRERERERERESDKYNKGKRLRERKAEKSREGEFAPRQPKLSILLISGCGQPSTRHGWPSVLGGVKSSIS